MYSHLEADGNVLTKAHCKAQSLPVVDRLLEPLAAVKFVEFALGGPLPNGNEPNVERMTGDELPYIQEYQDFPGSPDGGPIIARVMTCIGSDEDFTRLCMVGRNIQSLKSRLWNGIIPLSEQSWQEKGLDEPKNFDLACQHLSAVIAVFQYLNKRIVRSNLRQTFNRIYDIWAMLDVVLNERRAQNDQARISVAGLWTMYMKAHFEVMTERAHRWVIVHVNGLRAPLMQKLAEHRPLGGGAAGSPPDELQWKITDALQVLLEIASDADYTIMIPMNDYKGYTLPQRSDSTALRAADIGSRAKAYHERLRVLTRVEIVRSATSDPSIRSSGESYCQTARCQNEAQNQTRREMRGAPIEPIPREPWIAECASNMKSAADAETEQNFGMCVYRLTYGQTESEWAAFVQKVEAHVSDWGKGQTGSSTIKTQLKLHWLDGQELGIPEGNIEAAKAHFKPSIRESGSWSKLQTMSFLVVDSASFASYTTNAYGPATSELSPGDFAGFLLAVDPDYDEEEGIERPDESPGFSGQMRILGSLVWGDLYSRLTSQSAYIEDLWPLAIEHPNLVYVGPTIPLQRIAWKVHSGMRWALLRAVVDHIKLKRGLPVTTPPPQPWPTATTPPAASTAGIPSASLPLRQPNTSRTIPNPSPIDPSFPPSGEQAPLDASLRTYMLSEFQRYLRTRGETVPAAMAEELLHIQPNERPDPARIQQWVAAEEERRDQRRRDGQGDEASGEYQPQCPFQ
ncbi:hypothetical protein N7457_000402 [Penicillium paradoxum]|uniref:uncharacterized protein n=1 Tax=Penicillium paradoxum TaxID=176176 RepID=UPI002547E74B|nr:uncharacterized protein N7457_000402 [Penicillium paradoxum]KAJ5793803.1 hypothetical protein N7457_000402 [Penicillium paradoxum]